MKVTLKHIEDIKKYFSNPAFKNIDWDNVAVKIDIECDRLCHGKESTDYLHYVDYVYSADAFADLVQLICILKRRYLIIRITTGFRDYTEILKGE